MASSIDAASGPDAPITHNGKEYRVIKEGQASLLVPNKNDGQAPSTVFYNPIQQFNRDLSVLSIRAYFDERMEISKSRRLEKQEKKRKRKETENDDEKQSQSKIAKLSNEAQLSEKPSELPVSGEPEGATASNSLEDGQPSSESTSAPADPTQTKSELPQSTKKFTILDALSASGLRALRYSHELPFVTSVTANDLSSSAVETIRLNVQHNKLEEKIVISKNDAIGHMYRRVSDSMSNRDSFGNADKSALYDVIDLDPYGTAAPFLDGALQAVRADGGLLCITCTDSAIWAGHNYPEKCFSLYGGLPIKGVPVHEVGIRLILHSVATAAARYGLTIEPLLSLSIDFYVRVFVKVTHSPLSVKFHGSKTMFLYSCDHGCGAIETQPVMKSKAHPNKKGNAHTFKYSMAQAPTSEPHCPHCQSKTHLGGPIYAGYLHSPAFIQRILDYLPSLDRSVYGTVPRIEGMLRTALEEVLPGPPLPESIAQREREASAVDPCALYFIPARLSGTFGCITPNEDLVRGALIHLGYRVTRSHCKPGSIKTDAPWSAIMHIMRQWVKQKSPVRRDRVKPGTPAWHLLGFDRPEEEEQQPATNGQANGHNTMPEGANGSDAVPDTANAQEQQPLSAEEELRRSLVFDENLERLGRVRDEKKLVRYQVNPRENWGPMSRAKG